MSTTHSKHFSRWLYLAVILFVLSVAPSLAISQTISSVVPNNIQVEPDGKEVAVTINGKGLDKVTSVQVVMNNQPVSGVTTRLGPVTPTSRQVILKASPTAILGSNYQLRMMIGTVPINLPTQIVRVGVVKAVAAGAQPITPAKTIKHEPRSLQKAEVERLNKLVTRKKLAAIPHKPFTHEDFRDPKTGLPIKDDTVITLKNGKQIKGKDFLREVNVVEQNYNALGYTLRKPRKKTISAQGVTQPFVFQQSVINNNKVKEQRAKLLATIRKPVQGQTKVQALQALRARALPQKVSLQVVSASAIPQTHYDVARWEPEVLGDPNWVAGGLYRSMYFDIDPTQTKVTIEAGAYGYLVGERFPIVTFNGKGTASNSGGQMSGDVSVNLLGDEIPLPSKALLSELKLDHSYSNDQSRDMVRFDFTIGPVPVNVTIGYHIKYGIDYSIAIAPLMATANLTPHMQAAVYAQAGVDLGIAKAGAGAEVTLLDFQLPIVGALTVEEISGQPVLDYQYSTDINGSALQGEFYLFVEVDYLIDSETWRWDIFPSTGGFTFAGTIIDERCYRTIDVAKHTLSPCQTTVVKPPTGNVVSATPGAQYRTRIFEGVTTFGAGDADNGVWLMANYAGSRVPDLVFIKTRNVPTGNIEVHVASGASNYRTRIFEGVTTFGAGDANNGVWLMANYAGSRVPDLVFIKTRNVPTGNIEVHVASGASNYRTRIFEGVATFGAGDANNGVWLMANYAGSRVPDLVFIKTKNVPTGNIEVHVASGASSIQRASLRGWRHSGPGTQQRCLAHGQLCWKPRSTRSRIYQNQERPNRQS